MKKLNLPIIKGALPDPKWLSMDDYLKFVNFHLKYTSHRKSNGRWKKMLGVNVPFVLQTEKETSQESNKGIGYRNQKTD